MLKQVRYIATMLLVILYLSNLASAGTQLFFDDFKDYKLGTNAFPLWITNYGEWIVTEDGFQGTDCDGSCIAQGASTGRIVWTDYTLSLKLKLVSRGSDWRDGPWIGFRYKNTGSSYTVGFYDGVTVLHKASIGKSTDDQTVMAQAGITIKDSNWHDVKVTATGREITVTLDEKVIIHTIDNDWNHCPALTSGKIVLSARKWQGSTGKTQVVFKDVRVEAVGEVSESMKFTIEDAKKETCGITETGAKVNLFQFLGTRYNRRWTQVPRKVLAFYYPWYGRPENHGNWIHWENVNPESHQIGSATHFPAIGAYDSYDPETIDYHIHLARDNGIDGFICSWWGQGTYEDYALIKVLDRAVLNGFEVTVYWEIVQGEGDVKIANAVNDLLYILENYGSHPAFLKVDGKPVIFVYGRIMSQVSLEEWPEIITRAQKCYGKDFLLIADSYDDVSAQVFDGVHTYNNCGLVDNRDPNELRDVMKRHYTDAIQVAKNYAKISCVTVIPGYDDTKIGKPGFKADRLNGEVYKVLWEQAILADPDWILITSWNEWHEGSEIEPSWEYGDLYVKLTGEYSQQFKKTPYSSVKVPEFPAGISWEKALELQELYRCGTIAILPDFRNKAVLWLVNAGIKIKTLTWEEVLDSKQLNVNNYPVLIYACGEGYTQSLHKKCDVDEAIIKYLQEGGLLIALSTEPFPFFYNELGHAVVSARKFGFPIEVGDIHGWETPPTNVSLSFEVDNKILVSLPPSAPFPDTGDLRWRPCSGTDLFYGDVYLPLAQLKDKNGKNYGDGVAYIEHISSPPQNGKNIYVWMRMSDVIDTNDLLYELFRLAGEKMSKSQYTTLWDTNCDGIVNILDLIFIANRLGKIGGTADLNGDGKVDILDMILAVRYFGKKK